MQFRILHVVTQHQPRGTACRTVGNPNTEFLEFLGRGSSWVATHAYNILIDAGAAARRPAPRAAGPSVASVPIGVQLEA